MSSVEENIRNAFIVVHETHENAEKLMGFCRTIAEEKTNYNNVNGKFLRWRSDNQSLGWCIDDFILLFQRETDKMLPNEWRDGPIYAMEIMLSNDEDPKQVPTIYLSKFEYENIASWNKGYSPTNHWQCFYYPLSDKDTMEFQSNGEIISVATPKTKEIAEQEYLGLKKVSFMDLTLIGINAENAEEKIFGNFEKLFLSN